MTSSSLNQPSGGSEDEPNRYRVGGNYRRINFGTITVDWSSSEPTATLAIRDGLGSAVREVAVPLGRLTPAGTVPGR